MAVKAALGPTRKPGLQTDVGVLDPTVSEPQVYYCTWKKLEDETSSLLLSSLGVQGRHKGSLILTIQPALAGTAQHVTDNCMHAEKTLQRQSSRSTCVKGTVQGTGGDSTMSVGTHCHASLWECT